jgi:hypothetical protein
MRAFPNLETLLHTAFSELGNALRRYSKRCGQAQELAQRGVEIGEAKGLRESMVMGVQTTFRDEALVELTQERVAHIDGADQLRHLLVQALTLPTAEEMRQALEQI